MKDIFVFVYSGHELNIVVIQTFNAFILSHVINMNIMLLDYINDVLRFI